MEEKNKEALKKLLLQHKELGMSVQIDYQKFYLYSIITHSTAIEGSTVAEVEAQLLVDEGITSGKRTMIEQMMNQCRWIDDEMQRSLLPYPRRILW